MVTSQQPPSPTQTGLHFIANQQHVMPCANFTASGEITCRRHDDPAFALHRFDEKSRRVRRNELFQSRSIAEWHRDESRREWSETIAILLFRREPDDGRGASGEIALAHHELRPPIGNTFDL